MSGWTVIRTLGDDVPEGHLIHYYAQTQSRALLGSTAVSSPQGKFPEAAMLDGAQLERIEPYGKHLFYWWDAAIVHVHLGMQGVFLHHQPPASHPRPQVRLRIAGPALVVDLIAPIRCDIVSPEQHSELMAGLGPDPLRPGADSDAVWAALSRRRQSVGALLLDQQVIAGIGNVIRAEALYAARIHPRQPAASLSRANFDRLWHEITRVMRAGAAMGRIVTLDRPDGGERYVYKQETCGGCGSVVEAFEVGGRTAYACPVEQALTDKR